MKYIGEGYYYRVYELDADHVLKKLQGYWFSFRKIYSLERDRGGASFIQAITSAHKSVVAEKKALRIMKNKLSGIPLSLFANPSFVKNTLDYTQEKVVILGDRLSKKSIDDYIELQKKFWSYGLHDKTYKFQTNYGVDRQGGVVCIDFGEFAFTKEEALKSIGKQKWLSRQSYKDWKDAELKNYYRERMASLMTKENLDSLWVGRSLVS